MSRKNLFIVAISIIIVVVFSSCNDSKNKTDLENLCVKKKAISVTDTVWNVSEKFGEIEKESIDKVIRVNFNNDGMITECTVFNYEGEIKSKTIYRLTGKLIAEVNEYNQIGVLMKNTKYTYNNENIQSIVELDSTITRKWVHYYNPSNSNRLDSIIFSTNEYNPTPNGIYKDIHTFKYLDKNDSYIENVKEAYGKEYQREYYFDSKKRLIKFKTSEGYSISYTYNENGLCNKSSDNYGEIIDYSFEYDNKGSLIKRIDRRNGFIRGMFTRHIEYK